MIKMVMVLVMLVMMKMVMVLLMLVMMKMVMVVVMVTIQVGSCNLRDQCSGSPCRNGGLCLQNFTSFQVGVTRQCHRLSFCYSETSKFVWSRIN